MYFIVISQWPQTADTIMNNFLPRRPRTAGPRYLPSTTKPITPSSMSSITEWLKRKMTSLQLYHNVRQSRGKEICDIVMDQWGKKSIDWNTTATRSLENHFTYIGTCRGQQRIRLAWGWPDMEYQTDFWSRDRPCSGPGPNPRSAHYCPLGSGNQHYEQELQLKESKTNFLD